jgi:hypothetical protein
MTALGPKRWFTAPQQDVCNGGQTGQSADEARTGAFDPKLTPRMTPGRKRLIERFAMLLIGFPGSSRET